jgi:hypothetical protein
MRVNVLAQITYVLQVTIGAVSFVTYVIAVPLTAYNKETAPLLFPFGLFTRDQELQLVWLVSCIYDMY